MKITDDKNTVYGPPTIELHQDPAGEPEEEFASTTQVMVRLREKRFNDIVHRAAMLQPMPAPQPERIVRTPQKSQKERRRLFQGLSTLWPFGRGREREAHAGG